MIDRITVDPGIHFGKPCAAGTRITVQSVLELLSEGITFKQTVEDYYPDLTVEDIRACIIEADGHRFRRLPGQ
jgi:uncharacterized protein (DUF433 family)